MVTIKTPIWKDRSIGIPEYRRNEDMEITYTNKDGERLFPNIYKALREKIFNYPKDKKNPFLRIVPIKDIEEIKK